MFQKKLTLILMICLCICYKSTTIEASCDFPQKNLLICKDLHEKTDITASNETTRLIFENSNLYFERKLENFENLVDLQILFCNIINFETPFFESFPNLHYLTLNGNTNWSIINNQSFIQLKHLETLFITSNNLSKLETGCFNGLENLQVLELTYNNLKSLQNYIFSSLKRVTSLFIHHNNINYIERNAFEGLKSVSLIDLSFNDIHELNCAIFDDLDNLENLYLSHNFIKLLEGKFQSNSLKYLYLDHNELNHISPIFETESLTLLDLKVNKIENVEPQSFMSLSKLKNINLKNNSFSQITLLFKKINDHPKNIQHDETSTILIYDL